MNTNSNRYPVGIASQGRLLWLAPLILALFGCGGGGSADAPAADAAADAQAQPAAVPEQLTASGRRS